LYELIHHIFFQQECCYDFTITSGFMPFK
jgi:hypothetical protein